MASSKKRSRLEVGDDDLHQQTPEEVSLREMEGEGGNRAEEGENGGNSGEDEEDDEEEGDERVREQMTEFFSELDLDLSRQKRNLMTDGLRAPRRRSLLPAHLHAVMGSANLRLARGDSAGAIELCLEVIRQAPHSPEPYLTLSTIYEETGDSQKLLQMLVISAHLKRVDVELWAKAGHLALDLNNSPLASRCYQQASRLDPSNLTFVWRKASTYQLLNEAGKAMTTYKHLLQMLSPSNGHDIVEVSKELAQLHYQHCKDPQSAIDVLHNAVHSHMSAADDEAINLLTELYLHTKNYASGYELLTTYYKMVPEQPRSCDHEATPTNDEGRTFQQMLSSAIRISLSGEADEEEEEMETERDGERGSLVLLVPEDLPVDMRVKLALCMIHRSLPLPPSLLTPVTTHPEDYGDLFLDLAEAYTETGAPSDALPLLSTLVQTSPYNQAGVWLRHAECLHTLQDLEGAAMSYSHVLSLAPHHTDTRLALATIYMQLGRVEDALGLLESEHCQHLLVAMESSEECGATGDETRPTMKPSDQADYTLEGLKVLLQRYNVLLSSGRLSSYVVDGVSLLTVLFKDVFHRKDLRAIMHLSVRSVLGTKTTNIADSLLPVAEWWNLFLTTCKGLLRMGKGHRKQLLHLTLCSASLSTFCVPDIELKYVMFAASVCCILKEYDIAFNFIRIVCIKYDNPMLWNMLNSLPLAKGYQKYLLRLCFKHPTNRILLRIHANYSLSTSNYKFSLCLYDQSYRQLPSDYLTCLCIGCSYFNMASQKGALNRNQLVLQGVGFLHKYLRLRGKCQESMYNLGRAFHQIGVVHAACHFYRQALALEPENNHPEWRLASDLRPEAAFNLSLLYTASGNKALATRTLRQYCRI